MGKNGNTVKTSTIAYMIKSSIKKLLIINVAVVALIACSLYLFTRYTSVVNSGGIVRGGSQRAIKLVISGSDATKAIGVVDTNLANIGKLMHLGKFPASRNEVYDFWNNTIKKDITEYQATGDINVILKDSETLFGLTNTMVGNAQSVVNVVATLVYVLLALFLLLSIYILRSIYLLFGKRVTSPLKDLESNLNALANGNLSEQFAYDKDDEIGELYGHLNHMSDNILTYVQDIEKNLNCMADGDLVSDSNLNYIGDYIPIKNNIDHIRKSLADDFRNMDSLADYVAASAVEVSKVSQSLAEDSVDQTDSIQNLQRKIQTTLHENSKVEEYIEDVRKTSQTTTDSVNTARGQMERAVNAMDDISNASEEIRNIIKSLNEITDETSLLSLNASIEAARAGEAGKGFAIVAENVRKLADETSKSTESISQLIENSLASIARGTDIVNEAAQSLNAITETTENVDKVVLKLNEQSASQNELMQEINDLSRGILDTVTSNSAVSEECAASSSELTNYSDHLKSTVAKFRTE